MCGLQTITQEYDFFSVYYQRVIVNFFRRKKKKNLISTPLNSGNCHLKTQGDLLKRELHYWNFGRSSQAFQQTALAPHVVCPDVL